MFYCGIFLSVLYLGLFMLNLKLWRMDNLSGEATLSLILLGGHVVACLGCYLAVFAATDRRTKDYFCGKFPRHEGTG